MTILTKTLFNSGIRCIKKMWFDVNKTIIPTPLSLATQLNIQRGKEVDLKAQEKFAELCIIKGVGTEAGAEETSNSIKNGARKLAQATLIYQDLLARIDILERNDDNTWNIIEVKKTGEVKKEHIPDVAFQRYVAELCGLKISDCFLMYINKECVFPDLSNLFIIENINSDLEKTNSEFQGQLQKLNDTIKLSSEPELRLGSHCKNPHPCAYKEHCWKELPTHSIYTIPGIRDKKVNELLDIQVLKVLDVPCNYKLGENQTDYVNLIKSGIPLIDHAAIKNEIRSLTYPLYFLDFETDAPPIPRLNGMRPFNKIPFQFSLHVMKEDGQISHFEFLHSDLSDPREIISDELCNCIGPNGTIVVYYKPNERGILESLAKFSNKHRDKLSSILDRLWDLMDIFTKHYKHPNFAGSNSIKVVLETLVPHLSYSDLNIHSGDNASAKWVKMIASTEKEEQEAIYKDLKEYCALDSLGMLEIYKHLIALP